MMKESLNCVHIAETVAYVNQMLQHLSILHHYAGSEEFILLKLI
jgi:hypothetical protein